MLITACHRLPPQSAYVLLLFAIIHIGEGLNIAKARLDYSGEPSSYLPYLPTYLLVRTLDRRRRGVSQTERPPEQARQIPSDTWIREVERLSRPANLNHNFDDSTYPHTRHILAPKRAEYPRWGSARNSNICGSAIAP
jgi:hypothetical protein